MKRASWVLLPVLLFLAMPSFADAQRPSIAPPTVLFVCEHGTAKSLIAKVMFEEYAKEVGLHTRAESRGTNADSVVPAWMMKNLSDDKITLGAWKPQPLRPADLLSASFVVSFDVPAASTAGAKAPRTQWDGLPAVSKDYVAGRDAIKAKVHQLVDSLKRAEKPGK